MNSKDFDKGLSKFLIVIGIVFMILAFIAGVTLDEINWFFVGFILGGGSAALGFGGLIASKDDAVVSEEEQDG
jgi:uncharacterized membrane protein